MTLKYTSDQRMECFNDSKESAAAWGNVVKDYKEFYSAAYWHLLTDLWSKPEPIRISEAVKLLLPVVSNQTAYKYLAVAEKAGAIVVDPAGLGAPDQAGADATRRSSATTVALSPEWRERLDEFFDQRISHLRTTYRNILAKGPMPLEP